MLPASTLRAAPLAAQYGAIHRWMWLALPDDCQREAALSEVEHPHLTPAARQEDISFRLRCLRRAVWDREIGGPVKRPHGLRPSKLAHRRGYRRNKEVV